MFKNLSFSLIDYGIDFTKKRLKVIRDIIIKNEGEIIEKEHLSNCNIPDYILTSKAVDSYLKIFPELKEKSNNKFLKKVNQHLYNFEFISYCIKEKNIIDNSSFKIFLKDVEKKKKPKNNFDNFIVEKGYWNNNKEDNDNENDKLNNNNINNNEKDNNSINNDKVSNKINTDEKLFNDILKNKENNIDDYNEDDSLSISSQTTNYSSIGKTSNFQSVSHINNLNNNNSLLNKFAFLSSQPNLNPHLTEELNKLLEYHTNEGNTFEALAYRKGINALKKYDKKISTVNDIPKLKGIGKKITDKIKEILITGKCLKSQYVQNDNKSNIIKLLMSVHGIGIKQANEFYTKGIDSIEKLKLISNTLPITIQTGLKYYEDLQKKIPRNEITNIFIKIKKELTTILPEEILECEVVGSYRRGKELCGDIDILIARKDENGKKDGILQTLINKLMEKKIIIEILSLNNESYIFMGICKDESNIHRRIDIKVYNKEEFPFALLYFTGSAYFNRSMRLFARKKGFHLSDKELVDKKTGKKIECKNEEDIFIKLGVIYRKPEEREI